MTKEQRVGCLDECCRAIKRRPRPGPDSQNTRRANSNSLSLFSFLQIQHQERKNPWEKRKNLKIPEKHLNAISKIKLILMAEQKEAAPSGIAGLVRYEEEKSKINIKPEHVFIGISAIAEVEFVIQGMFLLAAVFGILFGLMFYWMNKGRIEKTQTSKQTTTIPQAQQQPIQQNAVQ